MRIQVSVKLKGDEGELLDLLEGYEAAELHATLDGYDDDEPTTVTIETFSEATVEQWLDIVKFVMGTGLVS